ncbi:hypothetical protein BH24ACT5_BH24ACT5_26170 [soil metagenome]
MGVVSRASRLVLLTFLLIVGLGVCIVIRVRSGSELTRPANVGVVMRIVDGDTIDVELAGRRERVRLVGIDTPEKYVDDGPPECFGLEASAYTAELLPLGSEVRLTRDVVGRDDYGRLLAYVYRQPDDLFVNMAIVANGYATPLTIRPNGFFADRFVEAARVAERSDLGLWAVCGH